METQTLLNTEKQSTTTSATGFSFKEAISYFQSRGTVIFISYCRFWERHEFVQQSVAKLLVENGVRVIWLDGAGWRPYRPTLYWDSSKLTVKQLSELPGRRFSWVQDWNRKIQGRRIRDLIQKNPGAVVWVQAGMEKGVAAELPYVDIYSTFDDPYRHSPKGTLCQKAKTILCQNSFAHRLMRPTQGEKAKLVLPPVELPEPWLKGREDLKKLDPHRSRKLGYIGSFFSKDYDLELFEFFVRSFPRWRFMLMGRTDEMGIRSVRRLQHLRNFSYQPWVPRNQVDDAWKTLDLTLLLYRRQRTQFGAFPVKVLESLAFGTPCVATMTPKTDDLEGYVLRSPFPDDLLDLAVEAVHQSPESIRKAYLHFAKEMHPKTHLTKVASSLLECSTSRLKTA